MEQSLVRQACWLEVTLNEKLLTRWPVVGVDSTYLSTEVL
jgi:hypothetical protein